MVSSWLREGYLTPCKQLYLSRHWRHAMKPHISPELGLVPTRSKFIEVSRYSVRASMQSWSRGVRILARRLRMSGDIGTWCPFPVGQQGKLEGYGNRVTTAGSSHLSFVFETKLGCFIHCKWASIADPLILESSSLRLRYNCRSLIDILLINYLSKAYSIIKYKY